MIFGILLVSIALCWWVWDDNNQRIAEIEARIESHKQEPIACDVGQDDEEE